MSIYKDLTEEKEPPPAPNRPLIVALSALLRVTCNRLDIDLGQLRAQKGDTEPSDIVMVQAAEAFSKSWNVTNSSVTRSSKRRM